MNIAEVSMRFGMPVDTIRYYEKIGLMDPVGKEAERRRAMSLQDLMGPRG